MEDQYQWVNHDLVVVTNLRMILFPSTRLITSSVFHTDLAETFEREASEYGMEEMLRKEQEAKGRGFWKSLSSYSITGVTQRLPEWAIPIPTDHPVEWTEIVNIQLRGEDRRPLFGNTYFYFDFVIRHVHAHVYKEYYRKKGGAWRLTNVGVKTREEAKPFKLEARSFERDRIYQLAALIAG